MKTTMALCMLGIFVWLILFATGNMSTLHTENAALTEQIADMETHSAELKPLTDRLEELVRENYSLKNANESLEFELDGFEENFKGVK